MNAAVDPPQRFLGMTPTVAAIVLIAASTLGHLLYCWWLPLLPDEAYYYQWSRHLDASYISKGPAVAYTIWAGTQLFGPTNFGVRFFAVMLSAGTAWQIFLLARRYYDETVALMAVLITSVVPIYALGAVVMTIDPLSAFFWIWAANCFSRATKFDHLLDWGLAGFAVGCGFLAKYLNALELLSFLAFLLLVPSYEHFLRSLRFWLMVAVAFVMTAPVLWWNRNHGWVSAKALKDRGHLHGGSYDFDFSYFLNFLGLQMVVISPLLFLALMASVFVVVRRWFLDQPRREGELLCFTLFVPVFVMYSLLAFHMRCEPNWPAISYLSLIIVVAAHWRKIFIRRGGAHPFIVVAFCLAWFQTLLMHVTFLLPLPQKLDPMGRVAGWDEIAARLYVLHQTQNADVLIADGYKEAAILSFNMPGQPFIFTLRHDPPATQYDLWRKYPNAPGHRALWITGESGGAEQLQGDFKSVKLIDHIEIQFRDKPFRGYDVYLCENPE